MVSLLLENQNTRVVTEANCTLISVKIVLKYEDNEKLKKNIYAII